MATTAPPRAPRGTSNGKAPIPDGAVMGRMEALVDVDRISVGTNVRADVGDVTELAESIRQHGVLQPIRIRPDGEAFELVYGQRRLAAAKLAGLERIPALIDTGALADVDRSVQQLVENIQRRDLNALEEAKALRGILDASEGMTQEQLAAKVGRSRPAVTNLLRILELHPKVQELVASGALSSAHAKALLALSGKGQVDMAKTAVDQTWSTHHLERQIKWKQETAEAEKKQAAKMVEKAKAVQAALLKQGVDKATATLTGTQYDYGHNALLGALKGLGWTTKDKSYSRGPAKICDCVAYGVSVDYYDKVSIGRRCIVEAHYKAKEKAAGKNESDRWKRQEEERTRSYAQARQLQEKLRPIIEAEMRRLDPRVGGLLLWAMLGYSVNDWVKDHKGDRKKPDAWAELAELKPADLAGELTRRIVEKIGPQFNVHMDWPAVVAAFSVTLDEPKAKKAAAS